MKLAKAAERAGLRSRIDHRPPSCLVRIYEPIPATYGYVAIYIDGKAGAVYWWQRRASDDVAVLLKRSGVRELTRRLTLTRRLRAAQAALR